MNKKEDGTVRVRVRVRQSERALIVLTGPIDGGLPPERHRFKNGNKSVHTAFIFWYANVSVRFTRASKASHYTQATIDSLENLTAVLLLAIYIHVSICN